MEQLPESSLPKKLRLCLRIEDGCAIAVSLAWDDPKVRLCRVTGLLERLPMLRKVHRTTFVRQLANLWAVKDQLWRYVLRHIHFDPAISLVDSFPIPVCRFARAYRCQRMRGVAAFG